jgi:hypothetical protein
MDDDYLDNNNYYDDSYESNNNNNNNSKSYSNINNNDNNKGGKRKRNCIENSEIISKSNNMNDLINSVNKYSSNECLSADSFIPNNYLLLEIVFNNTFDPKAIVINMHSQYLRECIVKMKYRFNNEIFDRGEISMTKTNLITVFFEKLNNSKILSSDNDFKFPNSNNKYELYIIICKLIFKDPLLNNSYSNYAICIIPGNESFEDLIEIVEINSNNSRKFYDKFRHSYLQITQSEKETFQLSNHVSIELFYKHIIFTNKLRLIPSNFELEWNNIWKYKALNTNSVINNYNNNKKQKTNNIAKAKSIVFNAAFSTLFETENSINHRSDTAIDKRHNAKSGSRRSRDLIQDLSNIKIKESVAGNNCWNHTPNLRHEALSNLFKFDNNKLELSSFIKNWIQIKEEIRRDLSQMSEIEIEKTIANTACLIAHLPNWFIEEPKPKKLEKLQTCVIDIDSVAISAQFKIDTYISFVKSKNIDFDNNCVTFLENPSLLNNENNKSKLKKMLNYFAQIMMIVLTGESDKSNQKIEFIKKFLGTQVKFSKEKIFSYSGKKNIIQKLKNSNKTFYWIPTESDSPFHFSISFTNETNISQGN